MLEVSKQRLRLKNEAETKVEKAIAEKEYDAIMIGSKDNEAGEATTSFHESVYPFSHLLCR